MYYFVSNLGLFNKMKNKKAFGDIKAKNISSGDIVRWSKWNRKKMMWEKKYGFVVKIVNEIRTNRLVSISHVFVYEKQTVEKFFTLNLNRISENEK